MTAFLRALSRRIRLALHRHDRIECWCELTSNDGPPELPELPVQQGSFACAECWTPPGYPHELSCPEVSPALFADYLAWKTR